MAIFSKSHHPEDPPLPSLMVAENAGLGSLWNFVSPKSHRDLIPQSPLVAQLETAFLEKGTSQWVGIWLAGVRRTHIRLTWEGAQPTSAKGRGGCAVQHTMQRADLRALSPGREAKGSPPTSAVTCGRSFCPPGGRALFTHEVVRWRSREASLRW